MEKIDQTFFLQTSVNFFLILFVGNLLRQVVIVCDQSLQKYKNILYLCLNLVLFSISEDMKCLTFLSEYGQNVSVRFSVQNIGKLHSMLDGNRVMWILPGTGRWFWDLWTYLRG
jgi:hypothetical protein